MGYGLRRLALAVALVWPWGAQAGDAALIVVQSDYRRLSDLQGAEQARALAESLRAAGFAVTEVEDESAENLWQAARRFEARAQKADRVFILLAGHIVATDGDGWLLGREAVAPDALSVGGMGLPVAPLMRIAGRHQGQAVVMFARGEEIAGAGLDAFTPQAPQGVSVLTGPMAGLLGVARDGLLAEGKTLAQAMARLPRGVSASGFVSDAVAFTPAPAGGDGLPAPETDLELAFWEVVSEINTPDSYNAYLRRFPEGRYTRFARQAIEAIEGDAERQAQEAEAALGLDRDARRAIQRNLSLLGYDPRGIDGIFGPGSRGAITGWQRAEGFEASGYLTADQLARLATQAEIRAAELEEEARRRKAEEERKDRAYWEATGKPGDEAGLRVYLKRYPDGLFADVAHARLDAIEAERRAQAAAEERAYWDEIRAADSEAGYRAYLERYPRGDFADAARARLDELSVENANADAVAAAQAEENRIIVNRAAAILVEQRLAAKGFEIVIDGEFDADTRRAIRRFQRERNLPVTGYIGQETMVHLLAG